LFPFSCGSKLRSTAHQHFKETKMRKIGTISLVAVSALALAAGITRASAPVATDTIQLVRQTEPGDDRAQGHGSDDAILTTRELELGDDNVGRGEVEPGDDKGAQATAEPGDDNGGAGEVESGDDKGAHATAEPGDDNGGAGEVESGDDKGSDKGGDDEGGHGSDD
jgi:hypothetical protein